MGYLGVVKRRAFRRPPVGTHRSDSMSGRRSRVIDAYIRSRSSISLITTHRNILTDNADEISHPVPVYKQIFGAYQKRNGHPKACEAIVKRAAAP
ncbi:unnamed protein product, partial [Iphiclides podalirius]